MLLEPGSSVNRGYEISLVQNYEDQWGKLVCQYLLYCGERNRCFMHTVALQGCSVSLSVQSNLLERRMTFRSVLQKFVAWQPQVILVTLHPYF